MNQLQTVQQDFPLVDSSVDNTGFDNSDKKIARRYIWIGYFIIFLFFGSVVAWSSYAPVSSAAIAPGVVGKDGYRKTVQHLEGGIIDKILVKDGDKVSQNQKLIELVNIQPRSDYDLLYKQKLIAQVKLAFLIAEQQGIDDGSLVFPDDLAVDQFEESVKQTIQGYVDSFHVRRDHYNEQLDIIDQRIVQTLEKIKALEKEQESLKAKGEIIAQEQKVYLDFEKKGLVTRAQSFALKRDKASNEADITANQVEIESTRQEFINLKMEQSKFISDTKTRVFSELDNVREQLIDLDEKLAKSKDKLERTVIRAPIDGVVVDLKVNTVTGVIRPGEPILDIVPEQGKLIIDARIDPKDRDIVQVGQDAEIRFTAFNQRITEPVAGKVTLISADSLNQATEDAKQSAYYKANVEILEDPARVLNGADVYPGMQAEVLIITGERTAMQYFLKPIIKSFNRAFRDE